MNFLREIEEKRDAFSIFHDGCIIEMAKVSDYYEMKVEIEYLAEIVEPGFSFFRIRFFGATAFEFRTWPHSQEAKSQKLTHVEEIFKPEYEILEANIVESRIQVICNQHSHEYDYGGGELYFVADSLVILDQEEKSYTIEELGQISTRYWENFSREKSKDIH